MASQHQKCSLRRASKEAAQFRIKRNRRAFKNLKALIEQVKADPFGRIELLLRLQSQLASHILRTEKGLRILKAEHLRILGLRKNRPSRDTSDYLKKEAKRLALGIDHGKHLLWIWRCFGDAIPFIYHDKYALKHMLYSIEDYSAKQSAGALSGNEGRRLEIGVMQTICNRGVPAMLCDLTNTLRHGDVCVMVNEDPFPIEVKASENQNSRTVRQAHNLKSLKTFLSDDEASNFRGCERVERRAMPMATAHLEDLNHCIGQSRGKRWELVRPEGGVTYLAIRRGCDLERLKIVELGKYPSCCIWSEQIESEAWAPYYPFTLSIERASDLTALLEGRLDVIVAVDAHEIMQRFADRGLIATFMEDEKVAFTVRRPNTSVDRGDPACGVSTHLMQRLLIECEPASNLIDFAVNFIESLGSVMPSRPGDSSQQDHQMMMAWRELVPRIPPLLSDDPAV